MSAAPQQPALQSKLRVQLTDRRARLTSAITEVGRAEDLLRLLTEVDAALSRLDAGHYGVCDVCGGSVDEDDLLANPMATYCLCKLSPERQRALERDLDLAWHVQAALLPKPDLAIPGWQTHYRYLPHGPVSGDYCDLIATDDAASPELYFMVGDVSGKGVAASLLMAHINAAFRVLAKRGLSPQDMLRTANEALAGSTLASHYATLVCGRACASGEVELANAGHCAPILVRSHGAVEVLRTAGLPLGLALGADTGDGYVAERVVLRDGDVLVVYTDGLSEAANSSEEDYGTDRLVKLVRQRRSEGPRAMITECLADLQRFLAGSERSDDLTILTLSRRDGSELH